MSNDTHLDNLPYLTGATSTASPETPHQSHHRESPSDGVPTHGPAPGSHHLDATVERGRGDFDGIDWQQVLLLRQEVASRLAEHRRDTPLTTEEERAVGREIIDTVITEHVDAGIRAGKPPFDTAQQPRVQKAVFDAVFGLGRLQPLVDDDSIEDIEIYGTDKVVVVDHTGRIDEREPIAETDAELLDMLNNLALRGGSTEKNFSPSNPFLEMRLHGGHRLAASGWVSTQPIVVIRRHRTVRISLDDLVQRDTLTPQAASFLAAAVKARSSIVISGGMGAGKTTLLRALTSDINPLEAIATIETDFELGLDTMKDRHRRAMAWTARQGTGEQRAGGGHYGDVDVDDILYRSLRYNRDRVIVGEVRGDEVRAMFKAVQAGAGSLSTIHARSARLAAERLVTLEGQQAGSNPEYGYRQVAQLVDILVHVQRYDDRDPATGQDRRHRFVSEIVAVQPGDGERPAYTDIFKAGRDRVLRPVSWADSALDDLDIHGYGKADHLGAAL